MKPHICLSLIVLLISVTCKSSAQAPPLLWQRCYGGDSTDQINCVKQTPDGGYIATGSTRSVNGDLAGNGGVKGLWVLKLDPWGNIQWEKTYSDTLLSGHYIEPTLDGGYILATSDKTIKLKIDGSIAWMANVYAIYAHQTSDSGYILSSGYFLYKLNPEGNLVWQVNYSSQSIYIQDVCQSNSGGYIITGNLYDVGGQNPIITKTDDTGGILIPVNPSNHGTGKSLLRTYDNNYLACIFINKSNMVVKLNDDCMYEWQKTVSYDFWPSLACTAPTLDNGAVAFYYDSSLVPDIWVNKYDNFGGLFWKLKLGGSKADYSTSGFQAANGNFIAAGSTYSNDGDVSGNHGDADGWIVEFGTNVGVKPVTTLSQEIQVYPIPAKDEFYIDLSVGYENATIKLTDVLGRNLSVKQENNGLSKVVHMDMLPAGVYLLQVENKGAVFSKKIVHY